MPTLWQGFPESWSVNQWQSCHRILQIHAAELEPMPPELHRPVVPKKGVAPERRRRVASAVQSGRIPAAPPKCRPETRTGRDPHGPDLEILSLHATAKPHVVRR